MTETLRQLIPDPVLARRARAGRLVRTIYATLLICLGAVLGWLMVKPLIYTETSGQVLAQTNVISSPYAARVVAVNVRPGTDVSEGDVVAKVHSPEVDNLLAMLATDIARQQTYEAEMRIRLAVASATFSAAERRLASAEESMNKLQEHCEMTSGFCSSVHKEYFEAARVMAQLSAERIEYALQISLLQDARQQIEKVNESVNDAFNSGNQVSPIDGIVSPRIANAGESVTAGEIIVEVFDRSDVHIDWVLDSKRVRDPRAGDVVYILHGSTLLRGHVTQMLSISENATARSSLFQAPENGRVVRLALDEGEIYPPLLSNVEVRYNYWRFMDPAVEAYVSIMEAFGIWIKA